MIGLIVILFIPVFREKNRLSTLFACRKENIDDNDQIKDHYENDRHVSPPQLSVSHAK